jgi:hypothetical protein
MIVINALIDECKKIFTILFIVWLVVFCLNITSCATVPQTIPVVVKSEYPTFIECPELPLADDINASNVANMISIIIANYRFCASEVGIAIKFKERVNK